MRFKEDLNKLESYQERLDFWTTNNLIGLTYLINISHKTVSHWMSKYIAIYGLSDNLSLTHITIEPQNAQECRDYVLWSIEKNNRKGCNLIDCYSHQSIKLYWERISKSSSHKEYLTSQLLEVQRFVEIQQKARQSILSALFLHSYDNCMNGLEPFNYEELHRLLFANAEPHDLTLLWDSCASFPNLLRGKAYAEYKGFLLNQEDRMKLGEDIRKQETAAPVKQKVVYQKADGRSLLSDLHPKVQEVAKKLFEDGHFRQALLDTYIALSSAVKQKSGLSLDNTPLMQNAFSPKSPVLTVSNSSDEQQGFMWLFSGAIMAIRNPKAHQLTEENDLQQALEWLFFASALFKILDKSKSSFE